MPTHKYAVGDRVIVSGDASNSLFRPGVYTIVRTLPLAGFGCQYRARNAADNHERVLDETLIQGRDEHAR